MAPSRWRPQQGDTQPRQQRGQIQKQQHDDTVDAFTVLGWRVNCQRNISALAQSIIAVSAGKRGEQILLKPADLVQAAKAMTARIAR